MYYTLAAGLYCPNGLTVADVMTLAHDINFIRLLDLQETTHIDFNT